MADIKHTYSTGTLGSDDPISLQLKIYYEISLHCTHQGYQGLWKLRKDSFVVKVHEDNDSPMVFGLTLYITRVVYFSIFVAK